MVPVVVLLTLLREVLRALSTPIRLLCYLPRRHHWRRMAEQSLSEARSEDPSSRTDEAVVLKLAMRARTSGRPRNPSRKARVFVSAGEASGEAHAARLVRGLGSNVSVIAFGGSQLRAAGADVRFALSEHAVMGLVSVLRQLPLIVKAYATFLRMLRDEPPDLVVLVDYPGLHLVMAKACRRRSVPVLHYVAPQYWAWGPWRMRRYRRSVDATLTILPFETAFFRRFHVEAHYIGHPLLDQIATEPEDPQAVARVRERATLCLLPGSRRSEIEANLPGMIAVARSLQRDHSDLRVVVAHRDPRRQELIRAVLSAHDGDFVELQIGPLLPWLAGSRVVLAKSGTGSLEACLFGNPVVVVYKLTGMLASIGYHNILSVPYIAAANLVANARVVPEFCFHGDRGWKRVETAVRELFVDGSARTECIAGLADVRRRLGSPGATERTVAIVERFLAASEGAS
ncbi:MAG: lipid-A-disaccharide synthase [Planctomycetota bacterium]